jgi:hypothetical protein
MKILAAIKAAFGRFFCGRKVYGSNPLPIYKKPAPPPNPPVVTMHIRPGDPDEFSKCMRRSV